MQSDTSAKYIFRNTLRHKNYVTSPHLSSSYPLAYKVLIHVLIYVLHLVRSLAAILACAHVVHPSCSRSCSVVRLHVVLGRPTRLLPSGCRDIAVVHFLLQLLNLWICPIHLHFLSIMIVLMFLVFVLLWSFCWKFCLAILL